jgi:hypothetical protein
VSENLDAPDCLSCPTHDAVLKFAAATYEMLARKVIFRLQRIKATGIYGDDYRHKTLWDEYCHEAQEGPYDLLGSIWDATIDSTLNFVTETIPSHEAALLTIGAASELDREDETRFGAVAPHLIQSNLRLTLAKMAASRNMSRFDPHND